MGILTDWLTDWLKEILIEGIMGNLTGLFDTVNTRVGEIAVQVGITPAAWNAGVIPDPAAFRNGGIAYRWPDTNLCGDLRAHTDAY